MAQVLLSNEVKVENLHFDKAKPIKEGSVIKSSRIGYFHGENKEEAGRLIVQSARMKIPFGIGNDEKFGDGKKWDTRLSFQGEERNKKIQRFRKCIEDINARTIKEGLKRCKEWLNDDDFDEKLLKKCFKSSIKASKKENYSDMFRISIPFNKENTAPRSNIEFYDDKGKELEWKEVTPGCEAVCLFEINAVWMSPGTNQFGLSIKLVQMQVFKAKQVRGYQIKKELEYDLSENENSEEEEENSVDEEADEEVVEVESDDE